MDPNDVIIYIYIYVDYYDTFDVYETCKMCVTILRVLCKSNYNYKRGLIHFIVSGRNLNCVILRTYFHRVFFLHESKDVVNQDYGQSDNWVSGNFRESTVVPFFGKWRNENFLWRAYNCKGEQKKRL